MKTKIWKSKALALILSAVMAIPATGAMEQPHDVFAAGADSQIHVYAPTGDNPDTPDINESPDVMSRKYSLKADKTDIPVVEYSQKGHNFDIARFASNTRTPEFTITVNQEINTVKVYPERYYPQERLHVSEDKRTLSFSMSEAAGLNSVIVMINGDANNQAGQPYLAIINDPLETGAPNVTDANVLNFKEFAAQYLAEHPNQDAQQPVAAGETTVTLSKGTANETSYTFPHTSGSLVDATSVNVRYPNQRRMSSEDMSYAFQAALDKIYATEGLDTLYFPNGTYTYAGLEIRGRSGKRVTIYLEEGALLKNRIQACAEAMEPAIGIWDSEGITVSGRGMFDGNGVENYWKQNGNVSGDRNDAYMSCHQAGVMIVRSKDITFNDTYMRNAKQWNWEAHSGKQISLNNIKGLTPYPMSWGDGTDMAGSQDLTINGAFTLGNDDCFASGHYNPSRWFSPEKKDFFNKEFGLSSFKPQENNANDAKFQSFSNAVAGFAAYNEDCDRWDIQDSYNIHVRNTLQWSCSAGNGIRLGHEAHGYQLKNYTFENFNALGFMGGGHGITVQNATDIYPRYETLKFINCSFDTSRVGNNFSINGGDGSTQNAVGKGSDLNGDTDGYTGQTITKTPIQEVILDGCWFSNEAAACRVTNTVNLTMKNLYVGGKRVTSTSDMRLDLSNVQHKEFDFAENKAPVFTSPQSDSFLAVDGQTLEFDVTAADENPGDSVTLQAENLPEGASFDPKTGRFSWRLTEAEVGKTYVIAFIASDPYTSVTKNVQIQVRSSKVTVESLPATEDATIHTWKTEKDWNRNRDYFRAKISSEALASPTEYGYVGEVKTPKDDYDLKMGLLKFDVSSLQGKLDKIESAELSLTYMGRRNSGDTGTDRIRAALLPNTDWSEDSVTWNTRPTFATTENSYRDSAEFNVKGPSDVIMAQDDKYNASQAIDGRRVSIDVTDFIQALEEGQSTISFAINETKGYELTFVSKDGATGNQNADASMAPTLLVSLKNDGTGPATADKTALQALFDEVKATDGGNYTSESFARFQDALQKAQETLNNTAASQTDVDTAKEQLSVAYHALEKKPAPPLLDLKDAAITLSQASFTYNGSAKKPSVTVVLGGKTLIEGTDYTISYTGNTNAGTAYVAIRAIPGKCTGSVTKSFTIKKAQKSIQVQKTSIQKTYGNAAFSLGASTAKGEKLAYHVNNASVVKVSSNGKASILGCGKATITIKSPASKNYNKAADKKITITVKPKKLTLKSVKSSKKGQMTIKWAKDKKASGYQICYSTSKNFKKAKTATITSNKTTTKTITKKLTRGKKYYVKIRAYKTVGKTKVYGAYSKTKSIKIKK
ncbi:DNRLRE domain-containing protein [Lachnospiraceae bacterium 29-84]